MGFYKYGKQCHLCEEYRPVVDIPLIVPRFGKLGHTRTLEAGYFCVCCECVTTRRFLYGVDGQVKINQPDVKDGLLPILDDHIELTYLWEGREEDP